MECRSRTLVLGSKVNVTTTLKASTGISWNPFPSSLDPVVSQLPPESQYILGPSPYYFLNDTRLEETASQSWWTHHSVQPWRQQKLLCTLCSKEDRRYLPHAWRTRVWPHRHPLKRERKEGEKRKRESATQTWQTVVTLVFIQALN